MLIAIIALYWFLNGPFSASFSSFHQLTVYTYMVSKNYAADCIRTNGPPILKATNLPTESQPLPNVG